MSIKRYRKKPVEVEAVQVNPDNLGTIYSWSIGTHTTETYDNVTITTDKQGGAETTLAIEYVEAFGDPEPQMQVTIGTLEGDMTAYQGDWIIRGVRGELYPCRSDIFAETYEVINE